MPRLKLIEMDSLNKMIYFRKDDKIVAFDADVAVELIADVLDDKRPIVVRCKDCRFHEREQPGMVWCPCVVGSWMAEDGFCSMGERKEDETD